MSKAIIIFHCFLFQWLYVNIFERHFSGMVLRAIYSNYSCKTEFWHCKGPLNVLASYLKNQVWNKVIHFLAVNKDEAIIRIISVSYFCQVFC